MKTLYRRKEPTSANILAPYLPLLFLTAVLWHNVLLAKQADAGVSTALSVTSGTDEKLRAAFGGICPADEGERRLVLLKQHGFNAALISDSGRDVNTALWKEWARLAHQYDIRLFPILSFAGTAEIREWRSSFMPYTTPDGKQFDRTPCPLDAEYWEQSVAERWETLALLSKRIPLTGVLIDMEMYGGDLAVYEQPCLCDHCWQEFVFEFAVANSTQAADLEPSHVPAARRDLFLKKHRLWPQYTAMQEQRLQRLLAQIEQRIHGVAPTLALGVVAYVDNWFYRSLIKGLGTSTQPVKIFSETFYTRGYSPDVLAEQKNIKQDSAAHYLPGLWQGRFFPNDLPTQATQLAKQTDGYWLFSADSLWTDEPKTGHYALHGTPAEYWSAWNKANAMIRTGVDETFFPSSVYKPDEERLQTSLLLKVLLRDMAGWSVLSSKDASQIIYEEQALFHFLLQPENVIRLTPVEFPSEPREAITYRLFDETGMLAQTGTFSTVIEFTIPAGYSGMMSLLVSSQKQGVRIEFGNIPWVVEASVTFPLATCVSPLTMSYAVLPEQEYIRFKVSSGTSEPTSFIITSPDGIERHSLRFQDFGEIRFAIGDTAKERRYDFWNVSVNASDSATTRWHYFYQTPLPYLIPKRIGGE